MSDLYHETSETGTAEPGTGWQPAYDAASYQHDDAAEPEPGARIADQDELPTPAESRATTWGDNPSYYDDTELGSEYDGDADAFIAQQDELPTPQESRARTWGDNPDYYDETDLASEYDGDLSALTTDGHDSYDTQEAAPGTWHDTTSDQDTNTDSANLSESPARQEAAEETQPDPGPPIADLTQPDIVTESLTAPAQIDTVENGTPELDTRQVAVHTQDGKEVPITVEYLPPEARTVGDDTPTGVGLKPTGEELSRMERDDPAESRLDRLLRKATEGADDLHDAVANTAESVHDFNLPGSAPSSGHAYEGHAAYEPTPPTSPGFSDLVGGTALVGVAIVTGAQQWFRDRRKGDRR